MRQVEIAAFHEAGHALAAWHFHRPIRRVEVDAAGGGGVYCRMLKAASRPKYERRDWEDVVGQEVTICVAGPLAEHIAYRADWKNAGSIDLQTAVEWLDQLRHGGGRMGEFIERAQEILYQPRAQDAIGEMSRRLVRVRAIDGADVERIFRAHRVPRIAR
jgi:hypothetical protein